MSNFSTAHNVTRFDSKKSQPLTGQRLAKVGYKSTAKNPAKFPSICASVPFIAHDAIAGAIPQMMGHIRAMLENAQDGILRSLYESSDGLLTQVTDNDLCVDACIKFLEAESMGTRLTKEFIESWFSEAVNDTLYVVIADKLGYSGELTGEQEATIGRHINGYKGLYSSLAGGKTVLQDSQINSLRKVLELVEEDDTQRKLVARLTQMQNKPKIEDLLEL